MAHSHLFWELVTQGPGGSFCLTDGPFGAGAAAGNVLPSRLDRAEGSGRGPAATAGAQTPADKIVAQTSAAMHLP
jgi:hypothetical protein